MEAPEAQLYMLEYITPSGVILNYDLEPESGPTIKIPQVPQFRPDCGCIEECETELGGADDEEDSHLQAWDLNTTIDQLIQDGGGRETPQNDQCVAFVNDPYHDSDGQAANDVETVDRFLEDEMNNEIMQNDQHSNSIDDDASNDSDHQTTSDTKESREDLGSDLEQSYTEISFIPDDGGPEIPAVYHHEIRRELLVAANRRGSYTFGQKAGAAEHDETSYFEPQEYWSHVIRDYYPPITFEYKKGERREPTYEVQNWYYKGKLVIDFRNKPVMRFLNIPDVLSSQYPGAFMQANEREDSRINHGDFLARMPPRLSKPKSKNPTIFKSLISQNGLAARMRRFRLRAGMISWTERIGTDAMVDFLEKNLSEDCKKENTTKGFRDLYPNEQARILTTNLGKFPNRSRHKDPEIRESYMKSMRTGLEKLDPQMEEGMMEPDDEIRETEMEEDID